jgi:hypothetical protein
MTLAYKYETEAHPVRDVLEAGIEGTVSKGRRHARQGHPAFIG